MYEHHRTALDRLITVLQADPAYLAAIITGTVARDCAGENSDIDVYLVVDNEEYAKRKANQQLVYHNQEVCDYPGGYVDGKILSLAMLEQAAVRGSEPMRASFSGARVLYSRIPGLNELIGRIAVYPEQNREQNMKDFYAQIYMYGFYFAKQAEAKNNPYLLVRSASQLVLFGGRVILAYNRILFPSHKGLLQAVSSAPEKPENFLEQAKALMQEPSQKKCREFTKMMLKFTDPGISYQQADGLYLEQSEWNWLDREPPLEDR